MNAPASEPSMHSHHAHVVPNIVVEAAAAPPSKRRRLEAKTPDCLANKPVACSELEPVATLCFPPSSASVHAEIREDTLVCFGMVGRMLL